VPEIARELGEATRPATEERTVESVHEEMMRRRDLWTDEMREIHARRKAAVDACLAAIAGLDRFERDIVKDRLLDLFDLEDGVLEPADVTPW
jgi:hypothetical protein